MTIRFANFITRPGIAAFLMLFVFSLRASAHGKSAVLIAPGTLSENSVTLLWNKQDMKAGDLCSMLLDGRRDGALYGTNYTLSEL